MAYLVRKIRLALWPDGINKNFINVDALQADTIISEFKTVGNELSWWKIEDLAEIEELSASIVSKFDNKLTNIDLIALPFEDIEKEFQLQNTPNHANTAVKKFREHHFDMCGLTYGTLGNLASIIARNTSLINNESIIRVKVKKAISVIKDLIEKGEVDKERLGLYVKKEMGIEDEIDMEISYHQKKINELISSRIA